MQQSETLLIEERTPPVTNPSVLVIGGAEDKVQGREILSAFFEHSGGSHAHIVIIPCASREPEATAERYRQIFSAMGAETIEVLDIRERSQGEDAIWEKQIDHCTGVFMTGGDQLRLCGLVADTPLIEQIRRRAQLGELTLAGTSAGAAAMGEYMIAGGGSGESPNRALVDMSTGLGIIPEVVVDQHFHNRNRMARLISAIAIQPDRIGIGIDEDTCALFTGDGCFSVLGKGAVTVIDSSQLTYTNQPIIRATDPVSVHNLKVHIMVHGDRYDLRHRRVIAPMD